MITVLTTLALMNPAPPACVIYDAEGSAMISAVMPPSAPQIGLAADGEVPVLTKMRSGELREGLWYSGASPTGVHSIRMPSALLWDAQGGWELTYSRMLLRHGPRDEVWTIQLPFASTIPNETEGTFFDPSARGQAVQELPSAIIPNYNSAGAPRGLTTSRSAGRHGRWRTSPRTCSRTRI